VCAAAGTPRPILETLNKHVAAAVASPDFTSVIEKTGVIPVSSSVDELAALINDTAREFGALVKELGIEQLD
jgi:tripartite-type tricarboxylate transporter receptor subunit TctC